MHFLARQEVHLLLKAIGLRETCSGDSGPDLEDDTKEQLA